MFQEAHDTDPDDESILFNMGVAAFLYSKSVDNSSNALEQANTFRYLPSEKFCNPGKEALSESQQRILEPGSISFGEESLRIRNEYKGAEYGNGQFQFYFLKHLPLVIKIKPLLGSRK
jgi:hypothetical protein